MACTRAVREATERGGGGAAAGYNHTPAGAFTTRTFRPNEQVPEETRTGVRRKTARQRCSLYRLLCTVSYMRTTGITRAHTPLRFTFFPSRKRPSTATKPSHQASHFRYTVDQQTHTHTRKLYLSFGTVAVTSARQITVCARVRAKQKTGHARARVSIWRNKADPTHMQTRSVSANESRIRALQRARDVRAAGRRVGGRDLYFASGPFSGHRHRQNTACSLSLFHFLCVPQEKNRSGHTNPRHTALMHAEAEQRNGASSSVCIYAGHNPGAAAASLSPCFHLLLADRMHTGQ